MTGYPRVDGDEAARLDRSAGGPDALGEAGGVYATRDDRAAVGIFAGRRTPFEDNVMAIRFLARLDRAHPDPAIGRALSRSLRAIATPDQIKARGRMLGDFLLAIEESRGVR